MFISIKNYLYYKNLGKNYATARKSSLWYKIKSLLYIVY